MMVSVTTELCEGRVSGRREFEMSRSRRLHPSEFRLRGDTFVRAGRSPSELSQEFEPLAQATRNGVRQADDEGSQQNGFATSEHVEPSHLQWEDASLLQEWDPPPRSYTLRKGLTVPTRILTFLLWTSIGVTLVSMLSDLLQLRLLSNGWYTMPQVGFNDFRQWLVGLIRLVVGLATSVTFLFWIHRANTNCHGFDAAGMRFSPGWSVGSFFIPILNLFKPYEAMKEIWRVSTDPYDWRAVRDWGPLRWWWGLWLLNSFAFQFAMRRASTVHDVMTLKMATTVWIIVKFLFIPLCLAALVVVSSIHERQLNLTENGSYPAESG